TAIVQDMGSYHNEAVIDGNQHDPVPDNNTSEVMVYPSYPPLELVLPCAEKIYDLDSLEIPGAPPGAVVSWHTATPASDANEFMGDLTTAATGQTYYVAFYDSIQDCYSRT